MNCTFSNPGPPLVVLVKFSQHTFQGHGESQGKTDISSHCSIDRKSGSFQHGKLYFCLFVDIYDDINCILALYCIEWWSNLICRAVGKKYMPDHPFHCSLCQGFPNLFGPGLVIANSSGTPSKSEHNSSLIKSNLQGVLLSPLQCMAGQTKSWAWRNNI